MPVGRDRRFAGRLVYIANVGNFALSQLLGRPVEDSSGRPSGRLREVALCPQDDPHKVSHFILRTPSGDRILLANQVEISDDSVRTRNQSDAWQPLVSSEGMLLLERDLLDQQIIDVHGRKVVRVNDVNLVAGQDSLDMAIAEVEVGLRGAVRRLLKGVVPAAMVDSAARKFTSKVIPWEFVNLIETDPARRIHLKIESERLARMHPADLADILEDLAPAEREAVFQSLDEDVAAEALEEIDPKLQASLAESIDSERMADIVEEMDPDAAADLLEQLSEEQSSQILEEMEPKERHEVEELLEFRENTAAGRMTTEYLSADPGLSVEGAVELLRNYEGGVESISTIYLVNEQHVLLAAVPLSNLVLARPGQSLGQLSLEPLISCHPDASERDVAERFDKYNLVTLPVVSTAGKLLGVITADDVIGLLRDELGEKD